MRFFFALLLSFPILTFAQKPVFRNENASTEARVKDLLRTLTLEEKVSQLGYSSEAIPRLGIPAYNWWNEALHGVARAGKATIFPQAIAMAASFDETLLEQVAGAISTEARAKYNLSTAQGRHLQYMGLTFWSPNINIFRDPRWGRGQETYGEDPFLTGTMGSAFVRGLQGTGKYLKASACAKHYAVHSGPEASRHTFNAVINEKDLRETYLYAFHKLVDAGVESVMCAYNRVNDEPCCTGNTLLRNILRKEWKFKGHVVTDCWALDDVFLRHKSLPDNVSTAAAAIKAGVNLDCSNLLKSDVIKAVDQKLLTRAEVDSALAPILRTRLKLGMFDDPKLVPYSEYGADSIANDWHRNLARKMATESMVLLKNSKHILPLQKEKIGAILVAGPNAASIDALLANYHGVSDKAVNFVEGIAAAVDEGTRVEYDQGCDYYDTVHFGGTWASSNADLTVAVIGLSPVYEGEEGDAFLSSGDRNSLDLPASHVAYIKALRKASDKPLIVVITAGSATDVSAIEPYADAIIYAWYPGEQGGNALADLLFGKVSPSGRLPLTFYKNLSDLPAFDNYNMEGRTYRYFKGQVQYPFGFGLSYTKFEYKWDSDTILTDDAKNYTLSVNVTNRGYVDADEVVQLYLESPKLEKMPLEELKFFKRISLKRGETKTVRIEVPVEELKKWNSETKQWYLARGEYIFKVGASSQDIRLQKVIHLR